MSFKLIISQEAQQDIEESIQFYNLQKENLGFEFYDCILEKFYKINSAPSHYAVRFKNVKASHANRFPFLIYFKVDKIKSTIIILGVLHTSRNPQIIKERK